MVATFLVPLVCVPLMSVPVQPKCTIDPLVPSALEAPILVSFNQRIDAYMQTHNDIERTLSLEWSFEDPEEMFAAVEAMQSGIRKARAGVGRGEIFSGDIAALIRTRLEARLAACNQTVETVLAFVNEERPSRVRTPRVHEPFPWELGSAMPASLLPALPPLPAELQYRFANRDLVVIDVHADLVVDILPNALPAPEQGDDES